MDRDGLTRTPIVDRNGVGTTRWTRPPGSPSPTASPTLPVVPPAPLGGTPEDPEPDYVGVCPTCDWRGEDAPFWADAMHDADEHARETGHPAATAEPVD